MQQTGLKSNLYRRSLPVCLCQSSEDVRESTMKREPTKSNTHLAVFLVYHSNLPRVVVFHKATSLICLHPHNVNHLRRIAVKIYLNFTKSSKDLKNFAEIINQLWIMFRCNSKSNRHGFQRQVLSQNHRQSSYTLIQIQQLF